MIDWPTVHTIEKFLVHWVEDERFVEPDVSYYADLSVPPTPFNRAVTCLFRTGEETGTHATDASDARAADAVDLLTAALRPVGPPSSIAPAERSGEALMLIFRAIGRLRLGATATAINDLFRAELLAQPAQPGMPWALVRRIAAIAYSELQWVELAVESQRLVIEATAGRVNQTRELLDLAGFHLQWAISLERLALTASSGKWAYRAQLAAGRAVINQLEAAGPSGDCAIATDVVKTLLDGAQPSPSNLDSLIELSATRRLTNDSVALIHARTARAQRLVGRLEESAHSVELAEQTVARGRIAPWVLDEVKFQSFATYMSRTEPDNRSGADYVASINTRLWNHEQDLIDDYKSRLEEERQAAVNDDD